MNKIIFTTIALCLLAGSTTNGQDMKALFTNMPDAYIPQLETAWRKDLADLFLAGKEARLKNTFNGYSILRQLTEDYVNVRSTERTTVEIKRLPLVNNTYIICMITTVEAPAPDSRIQFFTTEWQPLDSKQLFTPVDLSYFFKENISPDATALLDMDLIQYSFNAENYDLTATYSTPLYLSTKDRKIVEPYIKEDPKIYRWEKAFFSK